MQDVNKLVGSAIFCEVFLILVATSFSRKRPQENDITLAASAAKTVLKDKTAVEDFSSQTSQDHTELTEGQKKKACFEILNEVRSVTSHNAMSAFRGENTARGSKSEETHIALR